MSQFGPSLTVLEWGRGYGRQTLAADALAAAIVTIMLIPQSLAYAMLAGLPPETGLYASIAPLLAYAAPYRTNQQALGNRTAHDIQRWSATPGSFVSAPPDSRLYGWSASNGGPEGRLWSGAVALLLCAVATLGSAGSAQAATYTGHYDPAYDGIFPQLGWEASALFEVPDACLAIGNGTNIPIIGPCAGFYVLSAEVSFYNVANPNTILNSYALDPNIIVNSINLAGGDLSGIDTGFFDSFVSLDAFGSRVSSVSSRVERAVDVALPGFFHAPLESTAPAPRCQTTLHSTPSTLKPCLDSTLGPS
jgi:hypothetical protein